MSDRMIRVLLAAPLLTASDIASSVSTTLFNLGATVAGSSLRRNQ